MLILPLTCTRPLLCTRYRSPCIDMLTPHSNLQRSSRLTTDNEAGTPFLTTFLGFSLQGRQVPSCQAPQNTGESHVLQKYPIICLTQTSCTIWTRLQTDPASDGLCTTRSLHQTDPAPDGLGIKRTLHQTDLTLDGLDQTDPAPGGICTEDGSCKTGPASTRPQHRTDCCATVRLACPMLPQTRRIQHQNESCGEQLAKRLANLLPLRSRFNVPTRLTTGRSTAES